MVEKYVNLINGVIWADPMTILLVGLSIYFCVRLKFGTLRNWKTQFKLLISSKGSESGISSLAAFFSVAAYRVAIGNVGGVMVSILYGGPGAVLWMVLSSTLSTGIAYVENTLGHIYKIKQDGQYRGGVFYTFERGAKMKGLGVLYALMIVVVMGLFGSGAGASNIGMAAQNSFGIHPYVTGAIISLLFFLVIFGGIRRISSIATAIVPVMCVVYIGMGLITIIANIDKVPALLALIVTSAFNTNAVFGGMMGAAISFGVKRAFNSSGVGIGDAIPTSTAAETAHPAEQGLVTSMTVFIDWGVCLTSGIVALITDCYNVASGAINYVGQGSPIMAEQTDASVVWVQEGFNTLIPGIGGVILVFCIIMFAFSTSLSYYYEAETALTYLMQKRTEKMRKIAVRILQVVSSLSFWYWFGISASLTWSISEICWGLMIWINCAGLIFMHKPAIIAYWDYINQHKAGIKEPVFNPEKLGIKNAEPWMEFNKDRIAAGQ